MDDMWAYNNFWICKLCFRFLNLGEKQLRVSPFLSHILVNCCLYLMSVYVAHSTPCQNTTGTIATSMAGRIEMHMEKDFTNPFILMVVWAYQNLDGMKGFFHADVLKLAINLLAYVVCYFEWLSSWLPMDDLTYSLIQLQKITFL